MDFLHSLLIEPITWGQLFYVMLVWTALKFVAKRMIG